MIKYRIFTKNGYIETLDFNEAEAFEKYEIIEYTEPEIITLTPPF